MEGREGSPERGYEVPRLGDNSFSETVNSFPEPSQRFFAFLSNLFLEPDTLAEVRGNRAAIRSIRKRFQDLGLNRNQIGLILDHFNIDIQKKVEAPKKMPGSSGRADRIK